MANREAETGNSDMFRVSGRIRDEASNSSRPDLKVSVLEQGIFGSKKFLGSTVTDAKGEYEFTFQSRIFGGPRIMVVVYAANGHELIRTPSQRMESNRLNIDLVIASDPEPDEAYIAEESTSETAGVRSEIALPPTPTLTANTKTDEKADAPTKLPADLAPPRPTLDPTLEVPVVSNATAYEEQLGQIRSLLGDSPLAKLESTEIAALAERAGIRTESLNALLASTRLADRTNLPQELFFGLLGDSSVADLDALFAFRPEQLRNTLQVAVDEHKVPGEIIQRLVELEALRPAHESIGNLSARLGLDVSPSLLDALASKNIRTLLDIQKAGGLDKIEGLPTESNSIGMTLLDAHAELSRVSPDAIVNAQVIDRGFFSQGDIAAVQPHEFIGAVGGDLGLSNAWLLHEKVAARELTLRNAVTGALADTANRYDYPLVVPLGTNGQSGISEKCRCEDCASAVSPLAYLADLMDYSLRHLRNDVSPQVSRFANTTLTALIANLGVNPNIPRDTETGEGGGGTGGTTENVPPPDPRLFPDSGTVSNYVLDVRIESRAVVYYTLDRSDPDPDSNIANVYRGPIRLENRSTSTPAEYTVKALAYRENVDGISSRSRIVSRRYTLAARTKAAAPVIVPSGNTLLLPPATVFITCPDPNVDIRYTIDAGEPSLDSLRYDPSNPIQFDIQGQHTIRAKGYLTGAVESDTVVALIEVDYHSIYQDSTIGLTAEYYQDSNLTDLQVLRRDICVHFDWNDQSPDPRINPDTFSARWTGWITPQFDEDHIFYVVSDDGVKLWVNGQQIIDHWTLQSPNEIRSNPIRLQAGKRHSLKLEYFENQGRAVAMLLWSSPSQRKEVVSPFVLRPSNIDTPFLDETFYQPFSRLPASCKLMDEPVRQVRIAIEVLRTYSADNPATNSNEAAEASYRLTAYQAILRQLGTSFAELRLARQETDEERQSLADRIGIPLAHLDQLLLDPADDLNEVNLEAIFGLRDTHRDPLHAMASRPDSDPSVFQPMPKISLWRSEHVRTLWTEQDAPVDVYDRRYLPNSGRLPTIDPDVIGPDDFRYPMDGSPAFTIWLRRRRWVDAQLRAFGTVERATTTAKLNALFTRMTQSFVYNGANVVAAWQGVRLADFPGWYDDLTRGTSASAKAAASQITNQLHISTDAFLKLMAVNAEESQGTAITSEDWEDVFSILVSAQKSTLGILWLSEESADAIEFGPQDFWMSITEPKPGAWPPSKPNTSFHVDPADIPYIDPDLLKENDLPDPTAGKAARTIWQTRRAQLATTLQTLKQARLQSFDAMLSQAWGEPDPGNTIPTTLNLDQLLADLQGADETTATTATTTINQVLHLSADLFVRLMTIRAKHGQTDPQRKPTAAEYAESEAIVLQAYKFARNYPEWAREEVSADYWTYLKASLPRWLAGVEDRQAWQQALSTRCGPPIIDPDLVSLADIKTPAVSNVAYRLWLERHEWIASRLNGGSSLRFIRESSFTPSAGLDAIVADSLGIEPEECWGLAKLRDDGLSIGPRLNQWNLSNSAYNLLFRVHELAADSGTTSLATTILADEWEEVYSILLQVEKVRKFATWRREEAAVFLTLSQDFFVTPAPSVAVSPATEWQPVPWRTARRGRLDWEDRLQTRMDQEATANESIKAAVGAAEQASLPSLRDSLILNSDAVGNTLSGKAEVLATRFLIDMKTGGCQMTSRIAQAIETLQTLLWQVRTGQWQHPTLRLALVAPNFDEEWNWVGSYAMWRAAMFVFIYPENLLLPTLRKANTPGFSALMNNLRQLPRLTPAKAQDLANAYSDYFRDVCNLTIEISVRAQRRIRSSVADERNVWAGFFIGRNSLNKKVYWACCDWETDERKPLTYWAPITALSNVESLIAATVYQENDGNRRLYLFALIKDNGQPQLVFVTFDLLNTNVGWSLETTSIDKPDDVNGIREVRIFKPQSGTIGDIPRIALWVDPLPDPLQASMNLSGNGLNSEGWQSGTVTLEFGEGSNYGRGAIPKDQLGNPTWTDSNVTAAQLADLFGRVHDYAYNNGFRHAIPTLAHGNNLFGAYMLRGEAVEFRDIPVNQLNPRPKSRFPRANFTAQDFSDRLAAVQQYARDQGFLAGAPTFHEGEDPPHSGNTVYGAFLFKNIPVVSPTTGVVTNISAVESVVTLDSGGLNNTQGSIDNRSSISDIINRFQAYAIYIAANSPDRGGFPTFRSDGAGSYEFVRFAPSQQQVDFFQGAQFLEKLQIPDNAIKPEFNGRFDIIPNLSAKQATVSSQSQAFTNNQPPQLRIYFEEAWYFVPMVLAMKLQENGYYVEALDWYRTVYDYGAKEDSRRLYYGLTLDQSLSTATERAEDWLDDPLNPHLLAENRQYAYTRYTLFSIIRCLQDYADAEYTQDTSESVPRARQLYETALDLLETAELKQAALCCEDPVIALDNEVRNALTGSDLRLLPFWARIRDRLLQWNECPSLSLTLQNIRALLFPGQTTKRWLDRLVEAWTLIESVPQQGETIPVIADAISTAAPAWWVNLRQTLNQEVIIPVGTAGSQPGYVPALNWLFCVPQNPVRKALQLHAEINIYKIGHCRNIAGMERSLDIYAAATDTTTGMPVIGAAGQIVLPGTTRLRPSPYRYATLIERAKQLVQLAAQIEASMLSALEKRDAEAYGLLKARQDLQLARANVRLQDLKIKEASDSTALAELQRDKAQIQVDQYHSWISEPISIWEYAWAGAMGAAIGFQTSAATAAFSEGETVQGLSELAQLAQTTAQVFSQIATFERRLQDWQFSLNLAQQDVAIGNQQITISKDREQITAQEKVIAELSRTHDETVVNFLTNKFTNVELYEWMGNVLERVYAFFLQQATASAKLAEGQLTFERHEAAPGYIQADYWDSPSDQPTLDGGTAPDRRGLTGSARLLQDIYQLDLYAADRNRRKLDLSETISLGRMAPIEFQRFRETGVINFRTPMELFDRRFPGHYLRLIKRVRTSVIALIPPPVGIRASLTCSGLSRVVIGGDIFQTEVIRRAPETVSLTSPSNATGVFDLDANPEMLLPFEGMGVDTSWEFRMPKRANAFDYSTIADVLVTVEYTALDSYDYRQQVLQTLPDTDGGDRAFSLRFDYPDAWYDLNNAAQSSTPMTVSIQIRREDFPVNLDNPKIRQVALYFSRADGADFEVSVTSLQFAPVGSSSSIGGGSTTNEGIISTRRGNAGSWLSMIGKSPLGAWQLSLPNTEEVRAWFDQNQIQDILLVITYSGLSPAWPA